MKPNRVLLLAPLLVFVGSLVQARQTDPAKPKETGGGEPDRVIEVHSSQAGSGNFEGLWGDYRKALDAKDADAATKTFLEISRLRAERNVLSLEEMALALVSGGLDQLQKGERDAAETSFKNATSLDPQLPDAYLGLAAAQVRKGPGGYLAASRAVISALTARLPTARGGYYYSSLLTTTALLALFLTTTVFAGSMVIRYGTLLRHDLEEDFASTKGRPFAVGLYVVLLLLPLATMQGYGWLPLWWLALLFVYLGKVEKAAAVVLLLSSLAIGPAADSLAGRVQALQNPLFRAAMQAVEGAPDPRVAAQLEKARDADREDRDLVYLLAREYKKLGRYDDAAGLYREILKADANDAVALNNLGNIEFTQGEFGAAMARYKQGAAANTTPDSAATCYYNLQLAHLQRFEFDPATEARAQADRLSKGLTQSYESRWKYDKGGSSVPAVVDLSLGQEQLWQKFQGASQGAGRKNVGGKSVAGVGLDVVRMTNRFAVFALVFVLVFLGVSRWRGGKMFTLRCPKCGTPFCRRCHLGTAAGGLCTQCYHLFVVKDGVSGPARKQKLAEVEVDEGRKRLLFRVLSLLCPGAGQLYAENTIGGLAFVLVWSGTLVAYLLSDRFLPLTEAPARLLGSFLLIPAGFVLLLTYLGANLVQPSFEVELPQARRTPRRAPAARAAE